MRKPLKILAIVGIVLVVLVVALIVVAHLLVTPERVRAFVLPKAEAALGRRITLEEIEVNLFSGIALDRLVVMEKDGREAFLAADRVLLRYRLWPLLFRRVVVDEVRLEQPRIRFERLPDGTFNFSDLLQRKKAVEATPPPEGGGGAPVDLLVSEIALTKGEILFVDQRAGGGEPYRLQATAVELSASDISLREAFPVRAEARVNEGTIAVEGEINPQAKEGKVQADVAGLELAAFSPYFADKIPGQLKALRLGLRVTAEGGKEALRSQGTITLDPIDLLLARAGQEPIHLQNAALTVDYAVAVNLAAAVIDIEKATVAYNRLPIEISGRVEDYAAAPRVNLQVVLPETDLATALAALPPEVSGEIAKLQLGGKAAARLRLAGAAADPKRLLQEGELRLSSVSAIASGARIGVTGLLRLAGGALRSENLVLSLGENRAEIDLQAENLFAEPIRVRSAVRAERFALDPLLQASAAPTAAGKKAETKGGEPLNLPVLADGTVTIGETVYQGLTIRDFDLQYRLEKNVVTVQRLQGKVAGGSFGVTGAVDLGRAAPIYSSRLDLQGIQADPLVSAFWPKAAGTVFGTMNSRIDLEGRGTETEVLKRNLNARGEVRLTDGQLTGAGLMQGLAGFLNLEELRVLRFSQAKGSFTVREGQALVDSDIQGRDVRLHPQGSVKLDGYFLDLDLNLRLSPDLAKRANLGKIGRLLSDEQGWAQVPLKVGGTFEKPRFSIATGDVRERAGEEIRKRLEKELERKLPREQTPSGDSEPEQPSSRRDLEKAIRGLFGN